MQIEITASAVYSVINYNYIYLYYGSVHEVQRKLMTLSTSVKSSKRSSESFRSNISSCKTLDTATTQGSKLQKNYREQNRGETQEMS